MDELNFTFKMPDDESLAKYISIKGEKGDRGDPTKLSQLENDTNFVSKNTTELENYYTKAQTDSAIDADVQALDAELGVPDGFFTDSSETVSGEGQTITLSDTANAAFNDIRIYGDTQQNGTPTPDNPVEVGTVTGDQTVLISDGDQQSQSFTLSLGNLELCKVGTSQDYLYNNDGEWLKHREVSKRVFTGAETWQNFRQLGDYNSVETSISGMANRNSPVVSSHFPFVNKDNVSAGTHIYTFYGSAGIKFFFPSSLATTVAEWKAWLSENPVTVYYRLATATEDIIDTKLAKQLDAVLHAHSYDGSTQIIISGSLSATMTVEAFKNGWSGTIAGINNQFDDVYTKSETDSLFRSGVRYIFPKFWEGAYSGDCNLIKYQERNILIDCYAASQWSNVKAMLDENEATHLDYFILTHYHVDHDGNIANLINNGYIDENTVIYMSAEVTTYPQAYLDEMSARLAILDSKGLSYTVPQEGDTLVIGDDLKFTFYNCDKDTLDAYTNKDPNQCSTCIFIEHGNTRAFFAGDAGTTAFKRLASIDLPKYPVDLYKMGHHGINTGTWREFILRLSPKYALQPSAIMDFVKNNYGVCEETMVLKQLGTRIFPCHMQTDYIVFESDGSSVQCLKGKPYGTSDQAISLTYYVDKNASTNVIQDGSEEYPFSELMQAISSIPFKSGMIVTINVADGYYGNAHESEAQKNRIYIRTGTDVRLTINGNATNPDAVVLRSITVIHSDVTLNNLTVDVDAADAINSFGSTIRVNGLKIKSYTDTLSTRFSGLLIKENSNFVVVAGGSLRIEQCNECIITKDGSWFQAYGRVEIGSHNSTIANGRNIVTSGNFVFDNESDKLTFNRYLVPSMTPVQIMATHDSYAQTVTLLRSASAFSWMEIYYKTNDGRYGNTGRIYSPHNKVVSVIVPHKAGDGTLYNKQCELSISGTTIDILQSLQVHITDGSAPAIVEGASYFNIEKVIAGYYNDYIDLNS